MKTLLAGIGMCVCLGLGTLAYADNPKKESQYGWNVGDSMPIHTVDFAAGPGKHKCGCPSQMVRNAKGRGIMIWTKAGSVQSYELAAALDGRLSGDKKVQGFLLNFADVSLDELRKDAERHSLQKFQVSSPRKSARKTLFDAVDNGGQSEILIFFVDHKEIKAVWKFAADELDQDRIDETVRNVDRRLQGEK